MANFFKGQLVRGDGFDVAVTPTVTAGAYSAGDIMGGLLTFAVAHPGALVTLQHIGIDLKAAVAPSLTIHIFTADPTSTTKTDNEAYSLNAADAFKRRYSLALGSSYVDHGTPNSMDTGNIAEPIKLAASDGNLYALLVDGTGVTLTSTGDLQVRLSGFIG